ncbi:MgtC/SapB family protein [Benzoatithermus flavus]|uniref:MgtC/SapB family protein n=1 Tax=Benzoatithermus flavus TaxID=3108223 RepID=A0ABU8XMX9_9PROT
MDGHLDLAVIRDFATALLIGALIGIEREKRMAEAGEGGIGGLRTFILVALVGAVAGLLAGATGQFWLLPAALLAVAALAIVGYIRTSRSDPNALGLTTEVAALAVCLLGAMTMLGQQEVAILLAVVTAAVLAYKQPLHGLVGRLGWDDVFAGLRLLIATFVVLPLLPDRPVDPWQALNPYALWLLVILISGLSLVGYVATRWLGDDKGAALAGLTGGLVSSTVVTLAFARQSRAHDRPAATAALACGVLVAWAMMFARAVVEVLVVNPALVRPVLPPFAAMGLVAAGLAFVFYRRSVSARSGGATPIGEVRLTNPFSLTAAMQFAAFFAVVLLVVELVRRHFPGQGLYVVAALTGLTNVDAITLSMAEYARANDPGTAVNAIVIAAVANTLVKCGIVAVVGGATLRAPVLLATLVVLAVGAGVLVLA